MDSNTSWTQKKQESLHAKNTNQYLYVVWTNIQGREGGTQGFLETWLWAYSHFSTFAWPFKPWKLPRLEFWKGYWLHINVISIKLLIWPGRKSELIFHTQTNVLSFSFRPEMWGIGIVSRRPACPHTVFPAAWTLLFVPSPQRPMLWDCASGGRTRWLGEVWCVSELSSGHSPRPKHRTNLWHVW